jgi:hypothetical protein
MSSDKFRKWSERLWPWLLAALLALFFFYKHVELTEEASLHLLDKIVDICAISIGFWSTALTLLLALEDRHVVEGLRRLGLYERIVGFFLTTIYAFFVLLFLSLGRMATGRPSWSMYRIYVSGWVFVIVFSGAAMLRSFYVLGKLLRAK